jgi:hypothetical protein
LAFGRAVLDLLWFALFPRYARKKRNQMTVKFLAAAGGTSSAFVCRFCALRAQKTGCPLGVQI